MKKKIFLSLFLILICQFAFSKEEFTDEEKWLLSCFHKILSNRNGVEKYKQAMSLIPAGEMYKLFIDKKRLISPEAYEKNLPPHLIFDVKEPGYYNGMMSAFMMMGESIGNPLDLKAIIDLHTAAVWGVYGQCGQKNDPFDAKPCSRGQGYGVKDENFTSHVKNAEMIIAHLELKEAGVLGTGIIADKTLCAEPGFLSYYVDNNGNKVIISTGYVASSLVKLENHLAHYHEQISKSKTLDDTLSAITELLRAFEVAHIFPDGNQRTYAFLLLNRLLLENNLLPVILEEPEMFDGHVSVAGMVDRLKKGMKNFVSEFFNNLMTSVKNSSECSENIASLFSNSGVESFLPFQKRQHLQIRTQPILPENIDQFTRIFDLLDEGEKKKQLDIINGVGQRPGKILEESDQDEDEVIQGVGYDAGD
jgi:hypothetical protein